MAPRPPKAGAFAVGDRVFHQKFGYGRVKTASDDKLTVAFETAERTILASFVEKA